MKVVHISTLDFGGAAVAAIRLHQGLLELKIDSHLITSHKTRFDIRRHSTPDAVALESIPNQSLSFRNLVKAKFQKSYRQYFKLKSERRNIRQLASVAGAEVISLPTTEYRLDLLSVLEDADIVHLHWIADFIDYRTFFRNVKKPIVWTMHDENPFSGIFHYELDQLKVYNMLVLEADHKACGIKLNSLEGVNQLHLISPSFWLANKAVNSLSFKDRKIDVIPYGLDLSIFNVYPKDFARSVFNLPLNKIILLFVAEKVANRRKGFDLLIGAMDKLRNNTNLLICAVGNVPDDLRIDGVRYLGSIKEERLMALVYNAANAFVLPSREDNLPNTMVESLVCGTPVIGFSIGGVAETIADGVNGYLCKSVGVDELYNTLNKFLANASRFNPITIRAKAKEKFGLIIQAESYVKLYERIIS